MRFIVHAAYLGESFGVDTKSVGEFATLAEALRCAKGYVGNWTRIELWIPIADAELYPQFYQYRRAWRMSGEEASLSFTRGLDGVFRFGGEGLPIIRFVEMM